MVQWYFPPLVFPAYIIVINRGKCFVRLVPGLIYSVTTEDCPGVQSQVKAPFRCSTWLYHHKRYTRLEKLARDKHSSSLRTLVGQRRKFFIRLGRGTREDDVENGGSVGEVRHLQLQRRRPELQGARPLSWSSASSTGTNPIKRFTAVIYGF